MRKFLQALNASILSLCCLTGLTGCGMTKRPTEAIDTKVVTSTNCKFNNDDLSSVWIFETNADNRILKMTLWTDITKEDIENAYPEATDDEIEEIYLEYGTKQDDDYTYISNKYPKKSWFSASWEYDDKTYEIHAQYIFDVSYENLNYVLEKSLFEDFSLDSLWDASKQGFYYNEDTVNQALFDQKGVCAAVEEEDYTQKKTQKQDKNQEQSSTKEEESKSDKKSSEELYNLFQSNKQDTKTEESSDSKEKSETETEEKPNVNNVNENVSILPTDEDEES